MRRGVPGIFVYSSLDTSITRRHAIAGVVSMPDPRRQNFGAHIHAMPGPGNSIIVKNVPRSTNADVWDEWADEDEDDDFLSPEMRERLKALDAETAPPVDKCPIQHDLGDDDALKCSKDWVNAIVSDAGICPFSLSADRAGLPLGDVRYDVGCGAEIVCSMAWGAQYDSHTGYSCR